MKKRLKPEEIFRRIKCLLVYGILIFGSVASAAEARVLPVYACKQDPLASPGLSGFDLRSAQTVDAQKCSALDGQRFSTGKPSYAKFVFNADHDNLYFGAEVHDSSIHVSHSKSSFKNDGFEIFLDTRNTGVSASAPTPYFYQIVLNPSDGAEPVRKEVYRNPHVAFLSTYIRVVSERTSFGYYIKCAIPRKGLNGLDPAAMLPGVSVAWLNATSDKFQRCWWTGREFMRLPELNAYLAFPESDVEKLLTVSKAATAKAREKIIKKDGIQKKTTGPYQGPPVVNGCRVVSETLEKYAVMEGVIEGKAEYRNPLIIRMFSFRL